MLGAECWHPTFNANAARHSAFDVPCLLPLAIEVQPSRKSTARQAIAATSDAWSVTSDS